MTPAGRRIGRGWAYAGAVLGGAVSVAANVAHSYVPPPGAPAHWKPLPGAVLGAVFWPLALFVAIEILARTTWPEGVPWKVVRLCGLLPVAVVAAVVSYRHLSGLLRYYGEDGLTATFGPLAVDGLMIVASSAIVASASNGVGDPMATSSGSAATDLAVTKRVVVAARRPATTKQHRHREDARAYVRAELQAGRTPSGAAVGRRFDRNSRWGQRLVREVLAHSAEPQQDPSPLTAHGPAERAAPPPPPADGTGDDTS